MTTKYAGSEVLRMAIEIEKTGKRFYDGMAERFKDGDVQKLFRFLSQEEVRHESLFTSMLEAVETAPEKSVFDDHELALYFRSIVGDSVFPAAGKEKNVSEGIGDIHDALKKALDLEKDAILFFHEMKYHTREKDHATVEEIIEEERRHIALIVDLQQAYR
ncbi:ferritin family protein [bacterium]|nr:ferritin family protein [bacterium]